jgi:hypothetical protein
MKEGAASSSKPNYYPEGGVLWTEKDMAQEE